MPIDPVTAQIGMSVIGGLLGGRSSGAGQRVSQQAVNLSEEMYPGLRFTPYTTTFGAGYTGYGPVGYQNMFTQPTTPTVAPVQPPMATTAYTAPRSLSDLFNTTFTTQRGTTVSGEKGLEDFISYDGTQSAASVQNQIQRLVDRGVLTPQAGSMGMSQAQQMPTMMQPQGSFYSGLSGPYGDIQSEAGQAALGLLRQASEFSVPERAEEIVGQQMEVLDPLLAQQETQLAQSLFGSGRLGLQLAGDAAGAGRGTGMVNPDVFGFQRARGQMLSDLVAGSRAQAFQEQKQLQDLGQQMLGMGMSTNELEMAYRQMGLNEQQIRNAMDLAAAQFRLTPYGNLATAAQNTADRQMGLFTGISNALLQSQGAPKVDFGASEWAKG